MSGIDLVYVAIVAGLLLAILIFGWLAWSRKPSRTSYARQDFLLSPEERAFFNALRQALGKTYVIFARIPVDTLVMSDSSRGAERLWKNLQAEGEETFSFVLCREADLSIACAIQLIEHPLPGRKPRTTTESALRSLCQSAGLPLVRMETGPLYDFNEIREAVASAVRKEPLFTGETDVGRKEPTIASLERLEL